MRWKNKIWVIDDIIDKEQQEKIKQALLGSGDSGSRATWQFVPDVTGGGSKDQRPGFAHTFIRNETIVSHPELIKMLEPLWLNCLEKVKEMTREQGNYAAVAARAFLQVPLRQVKGGEYDAHHIDQFKEHFALLYYVCDADGDTVLFENMYSAANPRPPERHQLKEKKRVRPKQGRVVIFDGYYWHTATQPTKGIRCIINTNIVQQA